MPKQQNTVLSLEMALKAAVYTSEEQSLISKIADKNGWNITTLRNSLCPTTSTHKANIIAKRTFSIVAHSLNDTALTI